MNDVCQKRITLLVLNRFVVLFLVWIWTLTYTCHSSQPSPDEVRSKEEELKATKTTTRVSSFGKQRSLSVIMLEISDV